MAALLAIAWFVGMIVSIFLIFELIGCASMVRMFPEGRRWWLLPAQLGSLAFFAALVLFNPFMKGGA